MEKILTKTEADGVMKDASERYALIRKRGPRRDLSHLVEGTGNYAIHKGEAELAISKLHATRYVGVSRQIRKRVKSGNKAADMIAEMHRRRLHQ
jgi:hypothetical protein